MDGTSKAGGALSSVAAIGCPIEFIGTGEQMDDIEVFNARSFVSKMLGMGDLEGLCEKISSMNIDQDEITEKIKQGKLQLGDFKELYTQIMSLGPLSKMLEMIPGFQNVKIPPESKIKKMKYIFDSLNKSELSSNGDIFYKESGRLKRVAMGSGVTVEEVEEVVSNFRMMSSTMKRIVLHPMLSKMLSGDMNDFFRNGMGPIL
jgi:signal recognition particle subunit SRP54